MNAILVIFVMLVASLTTILTMDTITGSEGFSIGEVPNMFELLTTEENAKLRLLNDTNRFRFDSQSGKINILMPTFITGGLRIIGKNATIHTTTGTIGTMSGTDGGRYMIASVSGTNKIATMSPVRYRYSFRQPNTYIPGYPTGYYYRENKVPPHYSDLNMALFYCDSSPYCQGVTYNPNLKGYSLRGGNRIVTTTTFIEPKPSPYGEHSYVKKVAQTF
jgi:hypothetical protein